MNIDHIKFRVFIEGVLVKNVSAVSCTFTGTEAASASITIPPVPGFIYESLARARLHITWSNRAIRRTRSEAEWPTLFEGEINGDSGSKTPASRNLVYMAMGYSSYWEQILYYYFDFSQAAFAKWPTSQTVNLFTGNKSIEISSQTPGLDLQSQFSAKIASELGKPFSSMVTKLFSDSLSSNAFFSKANNSLNLASRFVAAKDANLSKLIQSKLFLSLVEQGTVSMDGTSSMMEVLKVLLDLLRYKIVCNPQGRIIKANAAVGPVSQTTLKRVTDEENARIFVIANKYGMKFTSLDALGVTPNTPPDSISGLVSERFRIDNVAVKRKDEIELLTQDSNETVQDVIDSEIKDVTEQIIISRDRIATSGATDKQIEKTGSDDKDLLSYFMLLPDTRFAAIPACNVIFPSEQNSLSLSRNYFREPTRYLLFTRSIAGIPTGQPTYMAPSSIGGARASVFDSEASVSTGYHLPVDGPFRISSEYGIRQHPVEKGRKGPHEGIDIGSVKGNAIEGKTIRAVADGIVKFSGEQRGYGNIVIIDHSNGLSTAYAHMSSRAVRNGQSVAAGQGIGIVGNTGTSTAPHLHFETRIGNTPTDPMPIIISAMMSTKSPPIIELLDGGKKLLAAAQAEASARPAGAPVTPAPTTPGGTLVEEIASSSKMMDHAFMTPEEEIMGIIPYFDYNFDPILALSQGDTSIGHDEYLSRLAESEFLQKKYETRNMGDIPMPFNPFPIPGLPGVAVDSNRSIIGLISSVTHVLDASGNASTTVSMDSPRYWNEGDPYYWRGGKPSGEGANFPDYYQQDLINTDSYQSDPNKNAELLFGSGRDRPTDKLYESLIGCKSIPYFHGERVNPATNVKVSYNKAIDGDDGNHPESTLVGKFYKAAEAGDEALNEFVTSFTQRLGASEAELMVDFLGSRKSASGTEYTGPAFRAKIQGEVRKMNSILDAKDVFRS